MSLIRKAFPELRSVFPRSILPRTFPTSVFDDSFFRDMDIDQRLRPAMNLTGK